MKVNLGKDHVRLRHMRVVPLGLEQKLLGIIVPHAVGADGDCLPVGIPRILLIRLKEQLGAMAEDGRDGEGRTAEDGRWSRRRSVVVQTGPQEQAESGEC